MPFMLEKLWWGSGRKRGGVTPIGADVLCAGYYLFFFLLII